MIYSIRVYGDGGTGAAAAAFGGGVSSSISQSVWEDANPSVAIQWIFPDTRMFCCGAGPWRFLKWCFLFRMPRTHFHTCQRFH